MANRYDTNLILDRIADALDDDQNSAIIASLEDIKIAIENGGGGGGGGGGAAYTAELIYSNPNRTIENTVSLDNPYTDYNYLVFEISDSSQYTHKLQTMVVLKEQMDDAKANNILLCYYQDGTAYLQYLVTDNTTLTKNNAAYECIVNIYGIKITGAGGGGDPHNEMIATEFSPASTYAFGDYCIHNDTYYKCINAINTPGAWDITDWQATNVGNEISALNSNILSLKLKKTSELTVNVQSLTWTQRAGCWTSSVSAANYFGSDYQNIIAVKITSYNGNPIMTFFDGSTIVFVSWTGAPAGPIKMVGYYNEVEISS